MRRGKTTRGVQSVMELDVAGTTLGISQNDLTTLMKLQEAGVIKLDSLLVPAAAKELTEWTYEDFRDHMVGVQDLRWRTTQGVGSTAMNRVKNIRYLENHPVMPVQLRPPSEQSWIEHVSYRRQYEDLSNSGLNHYRKALRSLLRFLGVPEWGTIQKKPKIEEPEVILPPDDLVPRFWMELPHPDPYLRETYSHMMHWGFAVGPRPPSELVALEVSGVEWDSRSVVFPHPKKGGKLRHLEELPNFLVNGRTCKSLRNYYEEIRPKYDHGLSDAFFLNRQGRPFCVTKLGAELSEAGKQIWPRFRPYTMRHWAATMHLIENGEIHLTALFLDDSVAVIERHYVDKAKARQAARGRSRIRRLQRKTV